MRIHIIAISVLLALMPIRLFAQNPDLDNRTIATYLEEYPDNIFSDFVSILKRTGVWSTINNKKGREYCCFAPTNEAIRTWLHERNYENVESIPLSVADSIAKKHICYYSVLFSDIEKHFLNHEIYQLGPIQNLLNRGLTFRCYPEYSDPEFTNVISTSFFINDNTKVIDRDYLLANGVLHVIDKVIGQSFDYIPGYLRNNNVKASSSHKANLFYQALQMTGLSDTLEQYKDFNYPSPSYDSTYVCLEKTGRVAVEYATAFENYSNGQQQRVVWPEQRLFKYTLFVVTDSVLERVYGIRTIDDLKAKARTVYPEGATLPDTDKNSSLNKLISYHILPCWLNRNQLNYTDSYVVRNYLNACPDSIDMEDFYETMHPYAIMRISTPYDQGSGNIGREIYINRKGTVSAGNLTSEGIRIWKDQETPDIITCDALNGGYYFVDSLLLFDQHTKNALNTRMRVMFSTLSPDFINSGARGRMRQTLGDKPTSFAVYSFKEGFCKNVSSSPGTMFAVRYLDNNFNTYYSDELTVRGDFDITFQLPPVPSSGLYEIRVSGNVNGGSSKKERGSILYYTRKERDEYIPCGTPVDMTIMPTDSLIGYVSDKILLDKYEEEEAIAAIVANDELMRKNGYMKYPDSYATSYTNLRNDDYLFRKIVCEMYMEAGKHYYLRLRQLNGGFSLLPLNFLEIVPYSVYSGENGPEDRH